MNCHLTLFLTYLGILIAVVGGIVGLGIVLTWLELKFGMWAPWTFLGCVFAAFLAGVAWTTPCLQ